MTPLLNFIESYAGDSLVLQGISNKIDYLQKVVSSKPSVGYSLWIPFLSALAGGFIVLAGQFLDRNSKANLEIRNNLRIIYGRCRTLEALMKNNYRELAMAKVHVEYWWYCNATENGGDSNRYYEEHLRSQTLAREIERKIGKNKAEYIGEVRKFQVIKGLKADIENSLLTISELSNSRAKAYDTTLDYAVLRNELVVKDERTLKESYYLQLIYFKQVNDYLQTLLEN